MAKSEGGLEALIWELRTRLHRGMGAGAKGEPFLEAPVQTDGRLGAALTPLVFANPPEPADFDSWMQAYACVAAYGDDLIMVYNGDDFGRAGVGWARLPGGAAKAAGR